ncbi:hypothetical protein VHEMI06109 [[Torrubiella] hemipterigena]|uniref:F-box domain-containing protein n=1 Tax=[Torrubiella] hemipterigena TaxID=1531966 RepID=A0A0A1TIN3_9HYPO|nr:hypothetical protein VHEMI06109 [[Torrubiella] hemipterigena]
MIRLPLEIVDAIIDKIDNEKTFSAAILCSRSIFNSHVGRLYQLNDEKCATNGNLESLANGYSTHACDWASLNGQLSTLKRAKEAGIVICDLQRLRWAVEGGHMAVLLYLLEQKDDAIDINSRFLDGLALLECAVLAGELEIVKQLVASGASIESNPNKENAFHLSVRDRHCDISDFFLLKGMDPSLRGPNDITTLNIAAGLGDVDMVKTLLAAGVPVFFFYVILFFEIYTPLFDAAEGGHVQIMRILLVLLAHGASISATRLWGLTALHIAARNGYTEAVRILLDHGSDISAVAHRQHTALEHAVTGRHFDMLELLIGRGASESAGDVAHALRISVSLTFVQAAEFLIKNGANVNEMRYGCGVLHLAAEAGNLVMIELLLRHGANISARVPYGKTPLLYAIDANQPAAVEALLAAGADIEEPHRDDYGCRPLGFAACRGHDEIVRILLDHGADMEARNSVDATAVVSLATEGHVSTMQLLLERGADASSRTSLGYNALEAATCDDDLEMVRLLLQDNIHRPQPKLQLHEAFYWACNGGRVAMVELFIEQGCNAATDGLPSGLLAMHGAMFSGNAELIDFLLEQDEADIDCRTALGRTPLFEAAEGGKLPMVEYLLLRNADPAAKDVYQAAPIFAAMRSGHLEAVELLVEACPESLLWVDGFGRTPVQWAELTGPEQLVAFTNDLLRRHELSYALEICVNSPFALPPTWDPENHWCAVCTRKVDHRISNMNCTVCLDGDFIICNDCVGEGMVCLDAAHRYSMWTNKGTDCLFCARSLGARYRYTSSK